MVRDAETFLVAPPPYKECKIVPAISEKTGETTVWDMFFDGVWHGSRRTVSQVHAYLDSLRRRAEKKTTLAEHYEVGGLSGGFER